MRIIRLPELEKLIPALRADERSALEAALVASHGPTDPIVVWIRPDDGAAILLDGHNRLVICEAHGLPYPVTTVDLPDLAAARAWMLDRALSKRNLSPDQQLMLRLQEGLPPTANDLGRKRLTIAQQILSERPDLAARVVKGELTIAMAAARSVPPKRREPRPAHPAPPPAPDPLDVARAAAAKREETRLETHALKAALAENDRLSAMLAAIAHENATPLPAIPRLRLSSDRRSGAAIILASDWHAGAAFEASASTFGNRFSPAICRYRVRRLFAGIVWHVKAFRAVAWDLRHAVLWLGGDLIDGHLHGDQQETSQSAVATIDWLEPLILDGVRSLLELDLDLQLVCSYGNHGRDTIKPRRQTGAEHSYEWGMYQRLGRSLRPDGVTTLADPTAHQYARVLGYDLHFTHGDETKYQGGVGGISIPLNKAFAAWDRVRRADYHHCGHYHTQLHGVNWFANGTLKGYDPFAMSVKGEPQTPRQTFYILDEKRGATGYAPLWVSDEDEDGGTSCAT